MPHQNIMIEHTLMLVEAVVAHLFFYILSLAQVLYYHEPQDF